MKIQPVSGTSTTSRLLVLAPGVILSLVAAGASYVASMFLPATSPLLVAILLGIIAANTAWLPANTEEGIAFSAKKLLRVGIVLLGFKLVLGDIWALGIPTLVLVVSVVGLGIVGTVFLGRLLRVPKHLTTLIACGFSICGAAAVAGAAGVTDPNDEDEGSTVTAVALVVIFGTLMIGVIPLLGALLHLDPTRVGMWAGASAHEVAQVVAIGDIVGGGALTVAVIVKLARVLLLAPVLVVLSFFERHRQLQARSDETTLGKLPSPIPLFVAGFLAMVFLRSFVSIPEGVLEPVSVIQTVLLAAAMFALGCGAKVKTLKAVGVRPFVLGALSTLLVLTIGYVGVVLVSTVGG